MKGVTTNDWLWLSVGMYSKSNEENAVVSGHAAKTECAIRLRRQGFQSFNSFSTSTKSNFKWTSFGISNFLMHSLTQTLH